MLVKVFFFHHGRNLPPPLPPLITVFRPSRRYARARDILSDAGYAPFVYIHAGGLFLALKLPPSKKIERDNNELRRPRRRRPRQSASRPTTTRMIVTSRTMPGTLGSFYFARGVSSVTFLSFYQCSSIVDVIFSLTCVMSAAASATTHVCQTPDLA